MTDRLPDLLDSNARVRVQLNGVDQGTRRTLNFANGVFTDDPVGEKVDVGPGLTVAIPLSGSPPAAPSGGATLYVDQVAGKNRLMILFPTGAAIPIAVEV